MTEFKVGDRVEYTGTQPTRTPRLIGQKGSVTRVIYNGCDVKFDNGVTDYNLLSSDLRILDEGPVRTVTRREIVAGIYDRLEVGESFNVAVGLSLRGAFTADEIDTLVQHLTEIAEALRAQ